MHRRAKGLVGIVIAIAVFGLIAAAIVGVLSSQWSRESSTPPQQPSTVPPHRVLEIGEARHRLLAEAPAPFRRCDEPIGWYIGGVDARFNVAEYDVHRAAERAAQVWQSAWPHQPLFYHDPGGTLPIHLAFDENLHEMYRRRAEYERLVQAYNEAVDSFNERARRYDANVEAWNHRGGRGTPAEFDQLEQERKRLQREQASLREQERFLETKRPRGTYHGTRLAEYFEQFTYDPETSIITGVVSRSITVHYFDNLDHLAFILAHELGHALIGQDEHVDDPAALMHATPARPRDGRIRLNDADREALRIACLPE